MLSRNLQVAFPFAGSTYWNREGAKARPDRASLAAEGTGGGGTANGCPLPDEPLDEAFATAVVPGTRSGTVS